MWRAALCATTAVGLVGAVTAVVPASAAPARQSVVIVAHTSFESEVAVFEASLDGCASGTVANGDDIKATFTPWGGVFIGTKVFSCAGGGSGFDVLLKARFGASGSTGTWVVADGWGDYAGMKGSGSLVGVPTVDGVDDIFTGTVR